MRIIRTELIAILEYLFILIFALPRLKIFNFLKRGILNLFGAKVGRNCTFYPSIWVFPGRHFLTGDYVDFAKGVVITTNGGVTIGNRVLIGYNTIILSRNHNIPHPPERIFDSGHASLPVIIEDDVWIGANCTILPGSHIKRGTVIAAGAVVRGTCESYSIYGGVPAKLIKKIE